METLAKRVGRGIREHRQRRQLTQMALAERAGLSVNHVSNVERGERSPRLKVVDVLARALGVDPANLFGGTP